MPESRIQGGVRQEVAHDSAHKHVSGEAVYIDDLLPLEGQLYAAIGMSKKAHARIVDLDLSGVFESPGVRAVMTAADVPGSNLVGPVVKDDEIFASEIVQYCGQSIFAVAADTVEHARLAATRARIVYEEIEPIFSIDRAMEKESFVLPFHTMKRGDSNRAISDSPHRLQGRLRTGGQDHFYLEGHVAIALPGEDGDMLVHSSTQHPTEVQETVAEVLNMASKDVTVEVRRMGGAFGGKEVQATPIACVAALLADHTGLPVNLRLDRDDDMILTGKRHAFRIDYDVGFDDDGRIVGVKIDLASRCGITADLSGAIADRAMFHSDNCYFLENVTINSHRCKTNTVSDTAFRGFGGPQGMLGIESVIEDIATALGKDPLDVRKKNLYGVGHRDVTPYGMKVTDNILHDLIPRLEKSSDYHARKKEIERFNGENKFFKRGISLTPIKFGISFTVLHLNQAAALINVYKDGTVVLNHGGTEMGQGLYTKVSQIVAEEFQIDFDQIKITATTTGKVPNTSATAASSGTDLNGKAAEAAARVIKNRLTDFAAEYFGVVRDEVNFENNSVVVGESRISFKELVNLAYHARVPLSATGFYATPEIHYDREKAQGRPFFYFAYGAAVSEVVIDVLTGENKVLRIDILHDVGTSINPAIDIGQVMGAFVQGMGWLTTEELVWDSEGRLLTHAPSTYKIPTGGDVPADFRVELMESGGNKEDVIYRSKAVGEPPLMLANSVFFALRHAVAATSGHGGKPNMDAPATAECILMAIQELGERGGN